MDTTATISLISTYPEAAALLVLIVGLFIAKIAQRQAKRLMKLFDKFASRYATAETTIISPLLVKLGQSLVYWLIVLLTVLVSLRMLGIGALSSWFDDALDFVPRLIIGLLIIGAGHWLGVLARYLISGLAESIQPDSLGPRIAHAVILIVAIVFGLQQMLIDISFITQLLLIPLIVVGSAMALAFSLGAKDYVANLITQSEWERFNIGDKIRLDGIEGKIVEKTGVTIQIETKEGIAFIPYSRLLQSTVLLARNPSDEK